MSRCFPSHPRAAVSQLHFFHCLSYSLLQFRNVTFAYPSRPEQPILTDFSCVIEPGKCLQLDPWKYGSPSIGCMVIK